MPYENQKSYGLGFVILVLWEGGSVPALGQGRGQGFRPCPFTPYTCPVTAVCQPFEEKGRVARVFTETLAEGMEPGMAMLLDTKDKGQIHLSLGPVWFLERQEFELHPGEEILVKGMSQREKDGKLRVIVFEVFKGDYVLSLRDSQGRPNWEAWRKK